MGTIDIPFHSDLIYMVELMPGSLRCFSLEVFMLENWSIPIFWSISPLILLFIYTYPTYADKITFGNAEPLVKLYDALSKNLESTFCL